MIRKNLMKMAAVCLTSVSLLAGCGQADVNNETSTGTTLTIGITQIVEHPALDAARDGFIEGLKDSGFEGKINFIEENAQGDMPTAQIIAQGFVDKNVDLIYAIATPTAQAAYNSTKDIPIMISAVTDPVSAGLVESFNSPNTNVSGTSDEAPIGKQLALIQELNLKGDTIGFIYNTSEANSEIQLDILKREASELGLKVESLGVTSISEMEQGLDVLLDKIDFLYTPTDNMVASSIQLITAKSLERKIPVIGAEPQHVKSGALITCGVDYFDLGKQTGIMAANVLNGEDISTMSIQKAQSPVITINRETADKLGIKINGELEQRSTFTGED